MKPMGETRGACILRVTLDQGVLNAFRGEVVGKVQTSEVCLDRLKPRPLVKNPGNERGE